MLTYLTPHLRLASVLDLKLSLVPSLGLDGLLLDLDCTLKDYHADSFRPEVLGWVQGLHAAGVRLCLLTNGTCKRTGSFARQLGIPFVAEALKPLPFGCRTALRKLG